MYPAIPLHGLTAATHTPFHPDGSLHAGVVEQQAEHLARTGVSAVFIAGTTGECTSLTTEERLALTDRWTAVTRGSTLRVVVHAGSNCLAEAKVLADRAQRQGAAAVAAFAPSYFKPRSVETLVAWCAEIAGAAPDLPFYFYDIPSMTGVSLPMPAFLEAARDRIPNLAGMKFTNTDLASYQECLRAAGNPWDIPFGVDEHLLGALAAGARGAVGSSFNFAAPVYRRLLDAFAKGDMETACREQFRSVQLIRLLSGTSSGYMGAAKAVMEMLGVPVGPARLPNTSPASGEAASLRSRLENLDFFAWL